MADLQPSISSSTTEANPTTGTQVDTPKEDIQDCFYFLTTGCTKGDQCKFRHKEEVKEVNMLCQRFLHGGCYNPDCKFIHLTILPSLAPKPHPKQQTSTKECIFFKKGYCKNGDKCPFLHKKDSNEAALINKLQVLLEKYENNQSENKGKRPQYPMKETPKRLRVHGTEEGDPLGYGKPLDESLSVRANRAKKFVNQTIQMHKKNTKETHSSIDDFVVHSRTELLAEIEAKKAAEMAKKNPVPSTPSVVPSTNGDDEDDEFKEDYEEMDRLLGSA